MAVLRTMTHRVTRSGRVVSRVKVCKRKRDS